jgi:3-oxoadipate enol-lactonase / 4-carboxymuconolactone decarboxylase
VTRLASDDNDQETDRMANADQSLTHGDVTINFRIDGADEAPPLLVSNSLGTDFAMWAPQVALLAASFRVIRYDTRGHGKSSVPAGPYTIDQLGSDVLALLDHLGIVRAHFMGLSMGGLTGLWLAQNAPQRIDRLVIANSGAKIGNAEFWNTRIEGIRRQASRSGLPGLPEPVVEGVVERWFTKRFCAIAPQAVAPIRAMLVATSVDGYIANCEAIRDSDLRERLAAVTSPTLVISGTHDPSTPPALGREIASAVPNAEYVELDAAHLSNIEQAGAFNAALLRFLTDAAITEDNRRAIGETMRRSVLGNAHVERSSASRTAFNGEFLDYITRTAWGETWTRPGLPRHTRSLLTIAMMVSLNRPEELRLHLNAARNNGVSRDDIKEVLMQTAVYCGVPAANAAFHLAAQVFAEQDKDA